MAGDRVADIFDRLPQGVEHVAPCVRAADPVLQPQGANPFIRRDRATAPAQKNVVCADGSQREDGCPKITTAVELRVARVEEGESRVAESVDAAAIGAIIREHPNRLQPDGQARVRRGGLEEDHVGRVSARALAWVQFPQRVVAFCQIAWLTSAGELLLDTERT